MSRLIDADKLPATCNVAIINGKVELNGWIAAERITKAPTVEAIPIEWFKNLIKTVEDSKNYEESEILKWALNKWENQEEENEKETN